MPRRAQAAERQQRLTLPATPFAFEVGIKNIHFASSSARTNSPSLRYFRRTERAAICAINAPR